MSKNKSQKLKGVLFKDFSMLKKVDLSLAYGQIQFFGDYSKNFISEFSKVLKFNDDFQTSLSVSNILDDLGFRQSENGYHYLAYIIHKSTAEEVMPTQIKQSYIDCAKQHNKSVKCIENSICTAIKNAYNSGGLFRLNNIFLTPCIKNGISNGQFINMICNRFITAKKYAREIHYEI